MRWMTDNANEYCEFVGDLRAWDKYIRSMSRPRTWGDQLTLRAVCDAFGVVIHLITTEQEHWHEVYQPQQPKPPFRHVFLAYISPIHYNALRSAI